MSSYTLLESLSFQEEGRQEHLQNKAADEEDNSRDKIMVWLLSILDWDKAIICCLTIILIPQLRIFAKQYGWLITFAIILPPSMVAIYLGMKKNESVVYYTNLFWQFRAFWHIFLVLVLIPIMNCFVNNKLEPAETETTNYNDNNELENEEKNDIGTAVVTRTAQAGSNKETSNKTRSPAAITTKTKRTRINKKKKQNQ